MSEVDEIIEESTEIKGWRIINRTDYCSSAQFVCSSVWQMSRSTPGLIVCLSPLHGGWLRKYSHNTENTFVDTENIQYDTVKSYNNYTKRKNYSIKTTPFCFHVSSRLSSFSPLEIHRYVTNVWSTLGSGNRSNAPGRVQSPTFPPAGARGRRGSNV